MVLRLTLGYQFLKVALILYSFLINVALTCSFIESFQFIIFILLVLRLHAGTLIKTVNMLAALMNLFFLTCKRMLVICLFIFLKKYYDNTTEKFWNFFVHIV